MAEISSSDKEYLREVNGGPRAVVEAARAAIATAVAGEGAFKLLVGVGLADGGRVSVAERYVTSGGVREGCVPGSRIVVCVEESGENTEVVVWAEHPDPDGYLLQKATITGGSGDDPNPTFCSMGAFYRWINDGDRGRLMGAMPLGGRTLTPLGCLELLV